MLSPTLFNLALEKIVKDIIEQQTMGISGELVMCAYVKNIIVWEKLGRKLFK